MIFLMAVLFVDVNTVATGYPKEQTAEGSSDGSPAVGLLAKITS